MPYFVEKHIASGYAYHYLNTFSYWKKMDEDMTESGAIEKCKTLTETDDSIYQVRDFYSGRVLWTNKPV